MSGSGAVRPYAWPGPAELAIRFALCAALVLAAGVPAAPLVAGAAAALVARVLPLLDPEREVLAARAVRSGADTVVQVIARRRSQPSGSPPGRELIGVAAVPAGDLLQSAAIGLILALGWPAAGLMRLTARAAVLAVLAGALALLDGPLVIAALLEAADASAGSGRADPVLVVWQRFLAGGGRLALGAFSGWAAILLSRTLRPASHGRPPGQGPSDRRLVRSPPVTFGR